uniref:Uncharacterized protein n=1 Tax=Spermophilus dauricus TaxID=99837 RepID=A0A8C9QUA7_SPEDA
SPEAVDSPSLGLEPCFQDDDETWADNTEEFQPEVRVEEMTEMVPPESQTLPAIPFSSKTHILAKLNFHLRKKVIEMQLGIPIRARESREPTLGVADNKSTQESLGSLSTPESTVVQELSITPESPPAPDSEWIPLKKQLATELKAVQHKLKALSSKPVPHGSPPGASKISQLNANMTKAQILCVQVEARKPKAAGDLGEGDAGLGISSISEERHPAEDQRPERMNRTSRGSWRWNQSFLLEDPCPPSHQHHPQLQSPEPPPVVPGGKESEPDRQDSPSKPHNPFLRPSRSHFRTVWKESQARDHQQREDSDLSTISFLFKAGSKQTGSVKKAAWLFCQLTEAQAGRARTQDEHKNKLPGDAASCTLGRPLDLCFSIIQPKLNTLPGLWNPWLRTALS